MVESSSEGSAVEAKFETVQAPQLGRSGVQQLFWAYRNTP